ncbi:uncharacterized protein J8A68_003352 [[Candida] subhashii]|uniref:MIF4G domain-containing protein n=1 Tax=[Candida] subhashii TaxID=561895 RepID=A0A8J5QJJ1_9ASCO|nr:uncharacterized protein J8A68_003352 [[Candida] subhashii]KAG7663174.1 hypothetical protein J8A68_003352 [[Candida] subhashii]
MSDNNTKVEPSASTSTASNNSTVPDSTTIGSNVGSDNKSDATQQQDQQHLPQQPPQQPHSAGSSNASSASGTPANQYSNMNYQQSFNPNYNNYNNYGNYGGSTGSGGNKHYNKNYSGRQNYNNNSGNGPNTNTGNQRYNNSSGSNVSNSNRKPYNQKHNQQQQQQQQQQGYAAAAAAAYGYGAPMYGYYYPQVYVPQMQQYIPGQPPYVAPIPAQHTVTTPPPTVVKLTTKDGRPLEFEDKKKKTPISSPHPVAATTAATATTASSSKDSSITPASTSLSPKVNADIPVKPAASLSAAAEEFKRKIRERAEAAAAKKAEEEKKAKESAPATTEESVTTEPTTQEAPVEEVPKVETPAVVVSEETPKAETPVVVEQPKEEEVKEEEKVPETKEEEPAPAKEEEQVQPEVEKAIEEPVSEPIVAEEAKPEEVEPVTITEEVAPAAAEEEEPEVEAEQEAEAEEAETEEPEEETATEEPEPQLTISQFLEKLQKATPIDDIFATTYPEGIQGVDSSRVIPGKKYRYDPQFLIQFRDVIEFTIDPVFKAQLEAVDIGVRRAQVSTGGDRGSGGGRNQSKYASGLPARFAGSGGSRGGAYDGRQNSRSGSKRRGPSSRDKSTRKGNQSKRGRGDNGGREKTEEEIAKQAAEAAKLAEDVKPLEQSANRWIPKSRKKKEVEVRYAEDGSIILEKDDVESKIKSLLNKLTLEMFQTITDQILEVSKQSRWEKDAQTIKQIVQLTFAKACDEPYWSEMYAKFCAKMCTDILPEITDETAVRKDGTHPSGGDLARRVLLTTCQQEYEKGWSDKLPTNPDGSPLEPEMMSDEYYAMAAAKRRGLGLVKFIGHLYNLNMLNDQVIFICLRDQCKNTEDPSEDSLENLAQLVKTVGPKLDQNDSTRPILKLVFENVQKVLDNEELKLPSRIKFMLMDLQDLRAAKWVSRKADAGPKTIEEIHRDAEIKKMEEQRQSNEKRQQRREQERGGSGQGGRSSSSRAGSSWNNTSSGSNPVNNLRKNASFVRSPSSTSSRPSSDAGNLQRETSKRSESTHINRFAALGADDDEDS